MVMAVVAAPERGAYSEGRVARVMDEWSRVRRPARSEDPGARVATQHAANAALGRYAHREARTRPPPTAGGAHARMTATPRIRDWPSPRTVRLANLRAHPPDAHTG